MRHLVMTFLLLITPQAQLFFAQGEPSANRPLSSDQSLEMTTIGEGNLFGRHAAFRTYETPDHTETLVWYGAFKSDKEAKRGTKQWLKGFTVTYKEHIKDVNGRVIGDRILAAPTCRICLAWLAWLPQGLGIEPEPFTCG